MNNTGAFIFLSLSEGFFHSGQVMPVDRSEIAETQRLKKTQFTVPDKHASQQLFHPVYHFIQWFADQRNPVEMTDFPLGTLPPCTYTEVCQIIGQRTDIRSDAHFIVVQHNNHFRPAVPGIVKRLITHTAGQRPVPDNRNYFIFLFPVISCSCHTERGRNRRTSVSCFKTVVFTFAPFRKSGYSAIGSQRRETVITARYQLVDITLVTDIEDNFIFGHMKYPVKGNRKLHSTEIGGEMPAVLRDNGNQFVSDLSRQFVKSFIAHSVQVTGRTDRF